ncbi:MAG: hypothetical protein H0X62_01670 [Bacteroidetes bacterium]|nr:hypothetical protein [Bacteroidota bacterium]
MEDVQQDTSSLDIMVQIIKDRKRKDNSGKMQVFCLFIYLLYRILKIRKMKYSKKLILGIWFLGIVTLQSCDPGTEYDQIIENKSKYDFWVIVNQSPEYFGRTYEKDSFFVSKNSEVTLYKHLSLGTLKEFENCDIYADSLTTRIENFDTLKLKTEINNNLNWNYAILEKNGRGGICECRIKINNDDIK